MGRIEAGDIVIREAAASIVNLPEGIFEAGEIEQALEIIPEADCRVAMNNKIDRLSEDLEGKLYATMVVPIFKGGKAVGEAVRDGLGLGEENYNPMRMTYYEEADEDKKRLEKPVLLGDPELDMVKIWNLYQSLDEGEVPVIILAEAVLETGDTTREAEEIIKAEIVAMMEGSRVEKSDYALPVFVVETLVAKPTNFVDVNGDLSVREFNLAGNVNAEFIVPVWCWIRGWECDDNEIGREERRILGRFSPFYQTTPSSAGPVVAEKQL